MVISGLLHAQLLRVAHPPWVICNHLPPLLWGNQKNYFISFKQYFIIFIDFFFFLWVKYSLISYVILLFSSGYPSLEPPKLWGLCLSIACFTERWFPSSLLERFSFITSTMSVYSTLSISAIMGCTWNSLLSCPCPSWQARCTKDLCNKQFSCWTAVGSD